MARTSSWPLGLAVAVGMLAGAGPARGQLRETITVDTATAVFREIMAIPEESIPTFLLARTQAIAIVPNVIKAGFVVGGRYGRGVLLVRDPNGAWSNPIFVTLTGGSVGLQAGAQATDLVLVFQNRSSLTRFLTGRGQFTLGADAAAAAGPVGRQVGAGTDVTLSSEIYTYSRSRGLFAGLSLEGASLALDWQANVAYYNVVISPPEILNGAAVAVPPSAARLKAFVAHYSGPAAPVYVPPAPAGAPVIVQPAPAGAVIIRPAAAAPAVVQSARAPTPAAGWKRPQVDPEAMVPAPAADAAQATAPPVLRSRPRSAAAAPAADVNLTPTALPSPAPKVLRSEPTEAPAPAPAVDLPAVP